MMDIQKLLKGIPNCTCGKIHVCQTDAVEIGKGTLSRIPDLCEDFDHILLVADQNTYRVCGKEVHSLLGQKCKDLVLYQTGLRPLIPNEDALAKLDAAVTEDTQLIIGVGSGVINDLCKQISFAKNLPYYIVATAPSMDGYTSVGAALILKGMKVTLNARPPKAVIADTAVLQSAPLEMIQAGLGDILGKHSCLNDWKLSALVNGEYFCDRVCNLVYEAVETVNGLAEAAFNREEIALGALMEALVGVGFAMSYVGNSRPASGSEHHLSHYFEITGILDKTPYFSHGIDVIYSSVVTAAIREKVLATVMPKPFVHVPAKWQADIRRIYSSSAEEVIGLQDQMGWYTDDGYENVCSKWEQIQEVLRCAPTQTQMLEMLNHIGLDYAEFEKLYGKGKIEDAILYAKDLKDRYSVLWLNYMYCQ